MTDYLRLAQQTALPQQDETQENPYLPIARDEQVRQQTQVRTIIETALKDDPELAAERQRLSQTSGLPLRVVERNLDQVRLKEQAKALDLVRMANESPVLYRQLTDPTFTTTAIDDLTTLQKIEQAVGKTTAYVMGATPEGGLPSDLGGAATSVGLGATVGVGKMLFDMAGVVNDLIGWDAGAAGARESAKRAGEAMDSFGFQGGSSTRDAIKSGLQSSGQNLALLPLGLQRGLWATANQAASAVAAAMATGVGADAFNRAREQGKNELQAGMYAIPEAAFEFIFERIPASKLFGDLAANETLLRTLGKQAISEGWTEQVTTLAQDFNEWMNLNPDKSMGEFIAERPEAAYQTFVATLVGVGVQTSTIKSIDKIVEKASQQKLQYELDQFNEQMKLASQSMLRQRSPEQFRVLVQNVVDESTDAKKEIYVDGGVLNQLPAELLAQLPESVREQIPEAAASNSVVAIPMADVLTVAPGTPLEQILNDNARMAPEALSRVEAQQASEQAQVFMQQEAERVLAQAADQATWQQSSNTVKQTVLDQLNQAGRFTPDVNEAYATLQANFFSTMAARLGITPQELYDRYALKVQAGGQQGAGTLEQITPEQAMATNVPVEMPTAPEFAEAVGNTPGAQVTENGLLIDLVRYQKPEQEGAQAIRTGVFYLPNGAATAKHYKTGKTGYGGTEKFEGQTLIRRPLFVKGATGGKAPEAAYDSLKGKKAYEAMRSDVLKVATGWGKTQAQKYEGVYQVLEQYGADPGLADEILRNSREGNQLPYAVAENIVAHAVREAGYDAVVGYSKGKAGASISEVFDVREQTFPARGMESEVHEAYNQSTPQTDTPEFKAWFGDSKVVDAEGKPLVVYHGTGADFTAFDSATVGSNYAVSKGFYFSDQANTATMFALRHTEAREAQPGIPGVYAGEPADTGTGGGNVMPVYLSMQNPLVKRARGELSSITSADHNIEKWVAEAKAKGNDGLIVLPGANQSRGATYIAFRPEQIKSAIGNRGTFDPNDPSILNQQARGTFNPQSLLVTLNENADLSTFLHESGHFFLEVLADLASQPNAPAQVREDMEKVLAWFGIKGDETVGGQDAGGELAQAFKVKPPKKLYRGVVTDASQRVGGAAWASLGRGLYTTPDKAFAKQFGAVVELTPEEAWPRNPFVVDNAAGGAANAVWNAIREQGLFRGRRAEFDAQYPFLEDFLIPLGYDGVVAGDEVVKYAAVLAQNDNLPTDNTQPVGRTPLETWNAMTLDQKRQHHERWAESFEAYLFEGKAPSAELQPLFRRFRSWLVNVYKSLKQFMQGRDLQMSDDIRKVFDRLIATDEQIAQAEEAAGMLPDFDATNEAIEKLTARSLRDLKWAVNARNKTIAKLQREAANTRKQVEAEVRAEVEQQPEVQAKRALDALRKSTPEYKAALTEWKNQRQATYDKAVEDVTAQLLATEGAGLKALEKGQFLAKNKRRIANEAEAAALKWERGNAKPERTLVGSDVEVAAVADSFGYSSVEEMLQAIDAYGPVDAAVEGMTDQRMLERYGDLTDQRAIEDAATEAVHNEARARALATELKAQAEMLNPRQDTGRTASNGRPITVNAITAAADEFAKNLAARRRVKDLKAATWQHRAAEARAGKRWQEATAAGKTEDAVQAKRDQVLNNYSVKALTDAQAEAKKIVEFFRKVTKGNDEKLVERGRDPDVVNAMRAILAAYGVAPRLEKSALEYMEVVAKNDPAMYGALKPSVDAALFAAKPLPEMTMEELRGLNDELRAMWELAKRSRQSEIDGNLVDREELEDELLARMTEIGIPDTVPGERGAITTREEAGIKLQFAKAILSRVEQWAERLDGAFGGPFLRYVFQPIKEAADRYRADRVKYRERFTTLVKSVGDTLKPGKLDAPELGYTFGNARDSGVAELLHAILHTGNESNKRKLLLGRGWAVENEDGTVDTSRWDAFMQRMHDEGVIGKVHYDFAQGVWDLLEEMKPLAQQAHRTVYGRYFAEVTADAVVTPFGTYRGGYVPAQTDARLVKDAKLRELAEGENESMAYAFPSAPNGFTKSRVEYNKPLMLDLRVLAQHTDKVLLFSHMQPAVTDVRRLLSSKRVSYALDRIDPGAYEGMLIPWLNRAAKQVVETPVVGDRKLSRFLSGARSRAGMALMFANLSNTFQQITGFSMAAVKVKPSLMMSALGEFVRDPKGVKRSVAEASAFMKDRMLNEVSAMNDAMEDVLVNPSLLERGQAWTQRHAYFMQSAVDNTMSPIIWTAAYNQAVAEKMSHDDAVRFADGVIRQTQGSTLPEDVSRFETGPGYARLFTQFVSYFNMMANTNATAMKQIADEVGLKRGAGKLLYVALAGMLVPIWVAEAIAQAFRGGPEDDDDDGYLDDWLMAVFGTGTLRGMVAQVPILGQAAQLVVNRFNDNPADDKFSLSPAVSLLESAVSSPASVYRAIMDEGNAQKAVRDVAAAATLITGLPIYAAARPVGYLSGVAQDKINPTSAVDLARGVVTGTASADSRTP